MLTELEDASFLAELEDWPSPAELDDGSPAELEDSVSSSLSLAQEKNVNDVAIMIAVTGMDIVLFILFFLVSNRGNAIRLIKV